MQLTLEARQPCLICGYRLTWLGFVTARINKRSIRTDGKSIYAGPGPCPECGHYAAPEMMPTRWSVQEQAKITTYRKKRGWL